jgi:DNA-directed RNA polymerase subunit RPC12/RpoP
MQKSSTESGIKPTTRRCMKCSARLRLQEDTAGICDMCAESILAQKKKRTDFLFLNYAFHLAMLLFVFLYFYRGVLTVYRYVLS